MLTLVCVIVGEGIPFSVKVETDELVDDLKVKIKERIEFSGPARRLQLYRVDGLVQKLSSQLEYNGAILDDFAAKTLEDFKGSCVKMAEAHRLFSFPQLEHVVEGEISILVVHPDITRQTWTRRRQPSGDCIRKTRESNIGRSASRSNRAMMEQRDQIVPAVFLVLDLNEADDCDSFGIGAFFSPTLAVICDRNLKDEHTVGSLVRVAWRHDLGDVEVVARNSELDFAILKSSKPRSFLAPWVGSLNDLESIYDVIGAYYQPARDWNKRQVFIGTSFQRVFVFETIPRYDPGTAIIVKDGCLVGIHVELMEAVREGVELKNAAKEKSNEEELSLDKLLRSEQFQGRLRLVADEVQEFRGGEQL